ncbi:MAG: hypothetical protein IJZ74_06130 [Clostridia bacterium]|nr:hypothetical protein [Clostridia bacterium]
MNRRKIHTVLVYSLIVLTALAIAAMMISDQREMEAKQSAAAALEEARRPYLAEMTEINTELAMLEREEKMAFAHTATAHILFAEPDSRILAEAVPLMAEYGYTGVVAVSETFFPGGDGCLTAEELNGLTAQGWEVVACITADTDVSNLVQRMNAAGIAAPCAAYFPDGSCTKQTETLIQSLGIPVIIQYGRGGLVDGGSSDGWYPVACGTMDSEIDNAFSAALSGKTALVLTEGWQNSRETFSQNDFRTNLDVFKEYEKAGQIAVTTIGSAYQRYLQVEESCAAEYQSWQTKRESLETRLREIEQKLRDLGTQNLHQ